MSDSVWILALPLSAAAILGVGCASAKGYHAQPLGRVSVEQAQHAGDQDVELWVSRLRREAVLEVLGSRGERLANSATILEARIRAGSSRVRVSRDSFGLRLPFGELERPQETRWVLVAMNLPGGGLPGSGSGLGGGGSAGAASATAGSGGAGSTLARSAPAGSAPAGSASRDSDPAASTPAGSTAAESAAVSSDPAASATARSTAAGSAAVSSDPGGPAAGPDYSVGTGTDALLSLAAGWGWIVPAVAVKALIQAYSNHVDARWDPVRADILGKTTLPRVVEPEESLDLLLVFWPRLGGIPKEGLVPLELRFELERCTWRSKLEIPMD